MEESRKDNGSKVNFFLGFFSGMAIISVIGFIAMLGLVYSNNGTNDLGAKAAVVPTNNNQPANNGDTGADAPTSAVVPVKANEVFKGGKDAKVVIIEYTDLECPYCLRHHATINQILSTYGNKVKYVLRHFPLSFHANAQNAANTVECAGEQGKYYQMVDEVFKANEAKQFNLDKFKEIAKNLGLNVTKFNDCLDKTKFQAKINQDTAEGQSAGVSGTPATFVNGELISGALPFDSFKTKIDGLLQ